MPVDPSITVRLATLQDAGAITAIYASRIQTWRHLSWDDQPIAAYNDLGLYERWQHAGMHGSIELCAVHLHRLLGGSATPLVALFADHSSDAIESEPLAEAEVYDNDEGAPFGHSLHIASLAIHRRYEDKGFDRALLEYIVRMAHVMGCSQITAVAHDDSSNQTKTAFYEAHGFQRLHTAVGMRVEARSGRAVYQTIPLADADPAQIRGWQMILGRAQASRVEWDALFPQRWAAGFPELADAKAIQTRLTVAGQNAIIFLQETGESGVCDLKCWSARLLTGPLLAALCDYVWREGFLLFRTLAGESTLPLLKTAEAQLNSERILTYTLPLDRAQ